MTIAYQQQNALADRLAREPMSPASLEHRVLRHLWVIDDDTGARARANRERAIEWVLAIFGGRGDAGVITGNSPGTKWTAYQRNAGHHDFGRLYTTRTSQVQRSFEDTSPKQRARRRASVGPSTSTETRGTRRHSSGSRVDPARAVAHTKRPELTHASHPAPPPDATLRTAPS